MIGNDIIDLNLAGKQSSWKRKGWLEKLFTFSEQEKIFNSSNLEGMLWSMWAMKEAAWKAHQRKFKLPRSFDPKSLVCDLTTNGASEKSGIVSIADSIYASKLQISTSHIHCIANDTKNTQFHQGIFSGNVDVKAELITYFSYFNNLNKQNLVIRKDENFIPMLFIKESKLDSSFSISQHGRFSAFVYSLRDS